MVWLFGATDALAVHGVVVEGMAEVRKTNRAVNEELVGQVE
jgi:hypothetical protein